MSETARRRLMVCACVCVALVTLLALSASSPVAAQPDCDDVIFSQDTDGTYLIDDVEELHCIQGGDLVEDYRLSGNIDASGTSGWDDGEGFEPIGPTFRGTFDGNGNAIEGLTVNRTSDEDVGLFSTVGDSASVENLELRDVEVTGGDYVGGLVGRNEGEVVGVTVSGTVVGDGDRNHGGIVGHNLGYVNNSVSEADVNGFRRVGGVVGNNPSYVTGSFSTGTVHATRTDAGGVVGRNSGELYDSYSLAEVSGGSNVGGVAGHVWGSGTVEGVYAAGSVGIAPESGGVVGRNTATVEASYWDTEATGRSSSDGGTGLTTQNMTGEHAVGNMTEFDFDETWSVVEDGYPELVWQTEPFGIDEGTDDDTDDEGMDLELDDDDTDDTPENFVAPDDEEDDGPVLEGADDSTGDSTGEDDSDDTDEGEGLPGFTVVAALTAVLFGILLRRNAEDGCM